MTAFRDWYYGIPFFTRYLLTLTLAFSILATFNFFSPRYLILDDSFINRFYLWRPTTALFYHPTNLSTWFHFLEFLEKCYLLYSFSKLLKSLVFAGKPADLLNFIWHMCIIIGELVGLPYLMAIYMMIISVLYVWIQLNKCFVTCWFHAMCSPWALLALNVIVSGFGVVKILGILVGHLAFLIFKYPQEFGGPVLLTPPAILKKYFPDYRRTAGFGPATVPALAPVAEGYN